MTPENAIATLRKQAQTAKRVAALRKRRIGQGLTRLELYAHQEDHAALKALAAKLAAKRSKTSG